MGGYIDRRKKMYKGSSFYLHIPKTSHTDSCMVKILLDYYIFPTKIGLIRWFQIAFTLITTTLVFIRTCMYICELRFCKTHFNPDSKSDADC